MHALGDLIQEAQHANQWSYGDIARRGDLGRSRVQQLAKDPIKAMPTAEVIGKLSRGLDVPGWVIVDALLRSLDLPMRPAAMSLEDAIEADVTLSSTERAALRAFASHLRAQRVRPDLVRSGNHVSPPITQAGGTGADELNDDNNTVLAFRPGELDRDDWDIPAGITREQRRRPSAGPKGSGGQRPDGDSDR